MAQRSPMSVLTARPKAPWELSHTEPSLTAQTPWDNASLNVKGSKDMSITRGSSSSQGGTELMNWSNVVDLRGGEAGEA